MNKREALAAAQKRIHLIGRYTVVGPHRDSDPDGPYTELQRTNHASALNLRTAWVASLALHMMGVDHEDIDYFTSAACGSARQRMTYALARIAGRGTK